MPDRPHAEVAHSPDKEQMMKFRFLWGGSNADAELGSVADRYLTRIGHFFPCEVIQVPPERGRQGLSDLAIMRAQSARLA